MKSIRLRIAAKLVLWIGFVSCVLGAGAYCVICMPEVMNLPFNWKYLVAVGAGLIIFILISAILHVCANHAANTLEAYCEKEEVEDVMVEMSVEPVEEVEEEEKEEIEVAFEPEEEPKKEQEPEKEEAPKKKFRLPKEKSKLIKVVAIVSIPVVVTCATAISIVKGKKKKKIEKERREKEANRQAFYRWLG